MPASAMWWCFSAQVPRLLREEAALGAVKQLIRDNSISLHGICLDASDSWSGFRDACLSSPEGSFRPTSIDRLPETLDRICLQQLNRYELSYSVSATEQPVVGSLKIWGPDGAGQTDLQFRTMLY